MQYVFCKTFLLPWIDCLTHDGVKTMERVLKSFFPSPKGKKVPITTTKTQTSTNPSIKLPMEDDV
jgi:hypothetical protein